MKNRNAKFLFVKPGEKIRLSNRKSVRYAPSGVNGLPSEYYCVNSKRSASQNRMKNHWSYR